MLLARAPRGPLRPFIQRVWVSAGDAPPAPGRDSREHVLPTGSMHIVLRLEDEPVRVWSHDSMRGRPSPVDPVGCVVADIGLSHRRFLTLFEQAVGLAPKRYCRVLRFQRAIAGVVAGEALGAVAIDAGYSDQAHLTREFQALAGVSPGAYRHISPERDHHVPVVAGSDFFKTAGRARPKLGS